jgi:hypothetical protein
MLIPSGDAACAAWAALPSKVRAEVVERAARFEGPPDPAVAAVVVGRIRSGVGRPWWRMVGAFGGTILAIGAARGGDPVGSVPYGGHE